MKKMSLVVPALVMVMGCQRPVTNPRAFTDLCGPKPTQGQAEASVQEWFRANFPGASDLVIEGVTVCGKADRRFGFMNLGARKYGWKITFYVKKSTELDKFADLNDILWNNGTTYTGNDGY